MVNMTNNTNIKITSVYGPPKPKLNPPVIDAIFNLNIPTIAVGDFNCKNIAGNSTKNNRRGIALLEYATKNNLTIHSSDEPTFYHINTIYPPDWLDIAITKNLNISDITALDELSSDHIPVVVNINLCPITHSLPPRRITNWEDFSREIDLNLGKITFQKNTTEIEVSFKKLTDVIFDSAINNSTTIKSSPKKAKVQLVNIINACLQHSYFPQYWKNADVIPIPKKGQNLKHPASYRPISLLSNLAKVMEKVTGVQE